MKLSFLTVVMAVSFLGAGCYQKHLLFEAETLSMTHKDSGGKKLKVLKPVEAKWCTSEKPVTKDGGLEVGMADQVIYRAQKGGKAGDFITEARIWTDTDGCAILEGKLAKIAGGKK